MTPITSKQPTQITVNFTIPRWGHACSIDRKSNYNMIYDVSGHSSKHMDIGDHIIFKSESGNLFGFRMKILKIEWCKDPSDMFFATCVFANTQEREDMEGDTLKIQSNKTWWETFIQTNFSDIELAIQKNVNTDFRLEQMRT